MMKKKSYPKRKTKRERKRKKKSKKVQMNKFKIEFIWCQLTEQEGMMMMMMKKNIKINRNKIIKNISKMIKNKIKF